MAESHRDEIAKLEALYANNPEGRVFTHLAEAYRKAGELDRARRIVEQGLDRHPDYSSAHVVLGRVLMDQGEDTASARAFERVLELDRHNLVALRSLGDVLHRSGQADAALECYRELLTVDPGDDRVRMTVARLEQAVADRAVDAAGAEADVEESGAAPLESSATAASPAEPEPQLAAGAAESAYVEAGEDAEPVTEPAPEQPARLEGLETTYAPDAGVEPVEAAPEPDEPAPEPVDAAGSDRPSAGGAGRPLEPWEERFAPPQPALPGDLAALAAEGGAPAPADADDEPIEFYDFRASALTEHGWARPRSGSGGPDAASDAPSEPAGSASDAGPPELESAYGEGDGVDATAGTEAWITEDDSPFDEAPGAGDAAEREVDSASGPESDEVGEWLSPEAWARLYGAAGGESAGAEPASPGAAEDEDEDEVLTETMAELYASQGFQDRAVEIYRALVRRQPDDERLQSRLREAEWAAQEGPAAAGEERGPAVPASEQRYFEAGQLDTVDGDVEPDDAWAEDVESAWTGGAGVAGADPTPYAWTDQEPGEEAGSRQSIGEYLADLLTWRPTRAPAVPTPAELEEAGAAGPDAEAEPLMLTEDAIVEAADESEAADASAGGDRSGWFERAGEGGPTSGEEDEDLEMFRSWLQSLKK